MAQKDVVGIFRTRIGRNKKSMPIKPKPHKNRQPSTSPTRLTPQLASKLPPSPPAIADLINNYNGGKWSENLSIINDTRHYDHNNVLAHTTIIYKQDGIEKLKGYVMFMWNSGIIVGSVPIMQMLAHRYVDAGMKNEAYVSYEMSISRAIALKMYRWVLSGYYYRALYADNDTDKEEYFIKSATYGTTCFLAYEQKMLGPAIWLNDRGSDRAKQAAMAAAEYGKRFPAIVSRYSDVFKRILENKQ